MWNVIRVSTAVGEEFETCVGQTTERKAKGDLSENYHQLIAHTEQTRSTQTYRLRTPTESVAIQPNRSPFAQCNWPDLIVPSRLMQYSPLLN